MKVPFFGNDRQFTSLREEWMQRAENVWSSGQYLAGSEIESLEKRLADMCGRKYAIALSSCLDALSISLEYIKVKKALVTNFSFVASASAITNAGGKPCFVPADAPALYPSICAYEKELGPEVNCVVGVALFGSLANLNELEAFCSEKSLLLIEDAAQSFGASLKGRKAGSFGFASCISFDPTKIISGSSPAGCLLTNDLGLAEYARVIRHHGKSGNDFAIPGKKSLMSSLEASLLDLKLNHLDTYINRRKEIASKYYSGLREVKEITLPRAEENERHTFHKYVIQLEERGELKKFLGNKGIVSRIHYDRPISHYELFKKENEKRDELTDMTCSRVLSLPLFPELRDEEIAYVISSIKSFFKRS